MSFWKNNKKDKFIKKKSSDSNFFDLIGTINWVEIPVTDIKRAVEFYKNVFKCDFTLHNYNNTEYAFFKSKSNAVKGTLVQKQEPISNNSIRLYFYVDTQLSSILKKVEKFGGKIIQPKTLIKNAIDENNSEISVNAIDGKIGYLTIIQDVEGNILILHSNS